MPQAVAAVIIAVGAAAGVAVPAGIATFAGNLIVIGGLTALQFALKPKVPKPADGNLPARQDMPARDWMFGRGRKSGALMFQEVADGGAVYSIYALTDEQMDAVESYLLHEDIVTLTADGMVFKHPISKGYAVSSPGRVQILTRQGLPTETAYAPVIENFPDIWGPNDRGDGIASLMMRCASGSEKTYPDLYPFGHPQPSVIGRWALCWDPRSSGQSADDPSTWTWTRNPIVQLLRFVCFHPHGYQRDWRKAYLPTAALWIAAMDVCDERVPLAAGGTIERYAAGGGFDSETERKAVAEELMKSCDGWFTEAGDGSWVVFAGKLYEPTFEIGPENIIGMSLQRGIPTEDRAEALVVTFTSPDHKYATVECDAWGEAAITAEGRLPQRAAVEAKWSQHFTQARRLAKRENARRKAKARGTLTTDLYGLNALRHRYIRVRWPMFPSTADMWVEVRKLTIDLKSASVLIEWFKVDPTVDAWTPALEEGARPPIPAEKVKNGLPAAPAPALVQLPGNIIQASLPPVEEFGEDDLAAIGRYRKSGETAWRAMTSADFSLTVLSEPVTDGVWEAQAAYTDGKREGPWSATATISTLADATPPLAPITVEVDLDGGVVTTSAKSAFNDTRIRKLETRRGTPAQAPIDAAVLGQPQITTPNEPKSYEDNPPPGAWLYHWYALGVSDLRSPPTTAPETVIIPGPYFVDTFNRANAPLGSPWTKAAGVDGAATIVSGVLHAVSDTSTWYVAAELFHPDHYAEGVIAFTAATLSRGLLIRYQDTTHHIALRYASGSWRIETRNGGAYTTFASSAAMALAAVGTLYRIEADGDMVRALVGGVVVIGWTSLGGILATGTKVGLYVGKNEGALLNDYTGGLL